MLGTVEIFIAKSIFDYSLGRPAWAHLHTTLTQMSQWWDESLMVYTWILKWCGWYVAPSFILYLHTTLTKMSQWWAPHTVQIDGAVYHRIKSSHRVHLWSGFCLICLAYYIRILHLSLFIIISDYLSHSSLERRLVPKWVKTPCMEWQLTMGNHSRGQAGVLWVRRKYRPCHQRPTSASLRVQCILWGKAG